MTSDQQAASSSVDVEAIRKRWCEGDGMRPALERIAWTQRDIAALLSALERAQQEISERDKEIRTLNITIHHVAPSTCPCSNHGAYV